MGGNPQGSKKNVQDFCRTLVIVKSSELTRTGREGGREKKREWRGRRSSMGCFGNEVKISGSHGEKSAKPSQKNGQRKPRQRGW